MLFFRGPSRKQTETLREVLERMEEIERGFKRMRLEWEDAFDKLQGVAQRVAKRAQRVEELANREHEEAEAPDAEASALGPEGNLPKPLTPRQLAAQNRILGLRSRLGRPS